jgi:hypothetical protein
LFRCQNGAASPEESCATAREHNQSDAGASDERCSHRRVALGGTMPSRWSCPSNRQEEWPQKKKTLNDLFEDALKDIYYAEKKILVALPKMQKASRAMAR